MKYIVWVKEGRDSEWEENGDGPVTEKTATRIVKELKAEGYKAKKLPQGMEPPSTFPCARRTP